MEQRYFFSLPSDQLIENLEKHFSESGFRTEQTGNFIQINRVIRNDNKVRKFRILSELILSFVTASLEINPVKKELICRFYFIRQLAISLFLGSVIGVMFAWLQAADWTLAAEITFVIAASFSIVGSFSGVSKIRQIISQSIDDKIAVRKPL